MNSRNEEGFNQTLKTLVDNDPGKLAFYNGLDTNAAVPPFVPNEETIELKRRDKARKTRLNAGMIASAAACLVFAILTANTYVPDKLSPLIFSDADKNLRITVADIYEPIQESSAAGEPLPLFLICAVACAAVFAVLLVLKLKKVSQ